ncbi:hypothetical protein [Roseinatronobacter sp.]|uniref:hypothetical protein n=1 Tax=Roseinatronobacter sp. TaxID=1945755 RepID=UPI0025E8EE19|nr:hypothetical protein [Roseibaca sp.]
MTAPRVDLLAALPDLVAECIRGHLPRLKSCEGMLGGFDLDELKRTGLASPAVLVSRLAIRPRDTLAGPHRRVTLAMAAFVVTRDEMGLKRDTALSNITATLIQIIPDNCWGLVGVGPAERIEERVLINRAARQVTASLAVVTWDQPVTLAELPQGTVLRPELYLGGDLDGEVT